MRLLFVIKGLVVRGGGAERVFVDVVNALAARGHAVEVATFDRPGQPLFYDLAPSIPVHLMGAGEPGVPTPRANLPKIMLGIRRLARRLQPDAAIAFMHSTYVPIAFGLAASGVPLVLSEHGSAAHFADRPIQRLLARLAQHLAFAKTVVSETIRAEHPEAQRDNLEVLPNPVELSAFAPARAGVPERVILCVGGLREEKGQAMLVEAFDRIAARYPDFRLRFVGDGVMRPQIEARIARSPHAARIELAGVQRDVAREYARAAFVVVPSHHEALSMAAIEAMASGRAVVGFADCAGPRALIDNGVNGLLVEPGADRAGALAEALDRLAGDELLARRMGEAAPATAEPYAAKTVIQAWEALLHRAADSRRGSA